MRFAIIVKVEESLLTLKLYILNEFRSLALSLWISLKNLNHNLES